LRQQGRGDQAKMRYAEDTYQKVSEMEVRLCPPPPLSGRALSHEYLRASPPSLSRMQSIRYCIAML
jgi:hypothetical protein